MNDGTRKALAAGYARMAAWSDLLDRINVFPVADEDTGRNLRISMAPLRQSGFEATELVSRLFRSATGNSGNIAAGFFAGFLSRDPERSLSAAAAAGHETARKTVADPRDGTMLDVFHALPRCLESTPAVLSADGGRRVIDHLARTVKHTPDRLPSLRSAGVIDAGALGMFLFFEGFLSTWAEQPVPLRDITRVFAGNLRIASGFSADVDRRFCIDTVVTLDRLPADAADRLNELGDSVVIVAGDHQAKIHMHTGQRDDVHRRIAAMGDVVAWSETAMAEQMKRRPSAQPESAVHVMTDAAGSVTREDADTLGITLLDSYVVFDERSVPETLLAPAELYSAMRAGDRVSTAQASVLERRLAYSSALQWYRRVLYLCVGSVFTGNHAAATAWQQEHDTDGRMTVVDTGAASGRLGVIALATARFARNTGVSPDEVLAFARQAVAHSREYLFLDRLRYLVAGGRLSKTKGFFGDLIGVKPVITPTAEGAVRAGAVRNREEQVAFAAARIASEIGVHANALILLQYSDNREWVRHHVKPRLAAEAPGADIRVRPLSLTSGAHMGPGTWGVAFLEAPV